MSSPSIQATLQEVLDTLMAQGKGFEVLLELFDNEFLQNTQVQDVASEGKSLGLLEPIFPTANLSNIVKMKFSVFIFTCCEWSRKGHKRRRLEETHHRFGDIGPPSTFGKNSGGGWPDSQQRPSLEVMCSRPSRSSWINARIMHPVFVEMVNAMDQDSEPDTGDLHLARLLTQHMPSSYTAEGSRRDTIVQILFEHLFLKLSQYLGVNMIADAYDTDGSNTKCGFNVVFKNEKGQGQSDPYMQNVGCFVKYWSGQDGPKRHCCPWILMEVLGQEIGLSVAAWAAGRPTCQPISPNIPFLPIPADRRIFLAQARLCKALRVGVAGLAEWYKGAKNIPESPQAGFPFPRLAKKHGAVNEVPFDYISVLKGAEEARKMLFVGRFSGGGDILIKFTDRYGSEVHNALARAGLAPILHDVRKETGLCMVVVDLICNSSPLKIEDSNRRSISNRLATLQKVLKENDMVHGDLRAPNIHLTPEGQVFVLDFDWAGKLGHVRYPDVLNPTETWPPGAQIGGLITKEHDNFMIKRLLQPPD